MSANNKDSLGDRIKQYESAETHRRLMPFLPIVGRFDGKSFSRFTRDMERPYDERMSRCMIETTKYLVETTNALIGYTQSDEITLVWLSEDINTQMLFGGKVFKFTSLLASKTTAKFTQEARKYWPEKVDNELPTFDGRIFQVPNKTEATNAVLWREKDATKNAISMAARSMYSHNALQDKSGSEMQEMMWQKGVNFNDYPTFFKSGTFVRKMKYEKHLCAEELKNIPESKRPSGKVVRSKVVEIEMPPFSKVSNREAVIFDGEEPQTFSIENA